MDADYSTLDISSYYLFAISIRVAPQEGTFLIAITLYLSPLEERFVFDEAVILTLFESLSLTIPVRRVYM